MSDLPTSRTYSITYRKHYATGSHQTARRTVRGPDLPTALADLERSIQARELNVTVSILAAWTLIDGKWLQMISH